MKTQGKASAEEAADELDETCRRIPGLLVYGVGIGDGELFVYCWGRPSQYDAVPAELKGFSVTIIKEKVAPGRRRKPRRT